MTRPLTVILAFSGVMVHGAARGQEPPPWPDLRPAEDTAPLPGTAALTTEGDLSLQLVRANDAFLDAQLAAAPEARAPLWEPGTYDRDARRAELGRMLGLGRDARDPDCRFEFYGPGRSAVRARTEDGIVISTVRWRSIEGISGDGLLLEPGSAIAADVVAIPDADQTAEEVAGLGTGEGKTTPFALALARAGCRVLVPTLVGRDENEHRMTRREWLHRPLFELGRHLLGIELHIVLAGVTALGNSADGTPGRPAGVVGWGEGGLLALYAAALDGRLDAAAVCGYFGPRENLWAEPAEHNIFGLLGLFGDAEIASLVAPRALVVESGLYPRAAFRGDASGAPEILLHQQPEKNGKPGVFAAFSEDEVDRELARLEEVVEEPGWRPVATAAGPGAAVTPATLAAFAAGLAIETRAVRISVGPAGHGGAADPSAHGDRQARLEDAVGRHHQRALVRAAGERDKFFAGLDRSDLAAFRATVEPYREVFRAEVVGDFGVGLVPPNPRSRPFMDGPATRSYEVVLDVGEKNGAALFAHGILTLPKDLDLGSGEKRPVVVCQHGLEGTPGDLVGEEGYGAYKAFATRLAERGFVTFAPQNGYKYFDLFRLQQFKAQSLGKTLFSLAVPQHGQITEWLASLPFVDPGRIGFYGLSYGGKSAMRIPPLVGRYCLSVCSADFNDWVWKNAATDPASLRYSYANKGEYEIFEWDLGGTFNYAEMAALICPRPFMVERGHFDGVAPDERVAHEFAKVRRLYAAELGIGGRCAIEWFAGPHTINGEGSFRFLHRHLDWPAGGAPRAPVRSDE